MDGDTLRYLREQDKKIQGVVERLGAIESVADLGALAAAVKELREAIPLYAIRIPPEVELPAGIRRLFREDERKMKRLEAKGLGLEPGSPDD